jgi:hypothetical protein
VAADDGLALAGDSSIAASGLANLAASDLSARSAMLSEMREFLDADVAPLSRSIGRDDGVIVSEALVAKTPAPAAPVTELRPGTDVPAQADAPLVAEAMVMPGADIAAAPEAMAVGAEAYSTGEVARVLAEALSGGGGNPLDALLDALPADAHAKAAAALGGWDAGHMGAFASMHAAFGVEALAIQVDAPPVA